MRTGAALLTFAAALAGCASTASSDGPGNAHTPAGQAITPQAAQDAIVVGQSTREQVRAALGPALTVPFDSRYEVWIYRWPGTGRTTRSATELVLLFDAAGTATQARIRPGDSEKN